MSRLQTTLAILLAAIGLFLSLWPALRAPVVLTSDSRIDLEWAKQGSGILTPAFAPRHPAKPAYLLFLRAATAAGGVRGIVVIQSLLLWISFGVTALQTAALRGPNWGLALYAVLVLFLRVRDLSSSVMSEALAAAIFLPLAALLLDSSRGHRRAFLLGLSIVALFLVRPNVGTVALLLAIVSLGLRGRKPEAATVIVAFLLVAIPVGILTSPSEDPLRGSSDTFLVASADYEWYPSIRAADRGISEAPSRELQRAAANWRTTLAAHGVDARRARVWRMLHGMLGTEYYDARWSAFYRGLTTASRLLSPFAILVAVAVLLAALGRGPGRLAAALGTCLVAALILQGIVLGALPRYGVPLLPGLFLFAVVAAPTRRAGGSARPAVAAVLLTLLVVFVAWQRQVTAWEWGVIESAGVRIRQTLPRRALPVGAPATLHLRIAPLALPSGAHLEVRGPEGELLFRSTDGAARESPVVSFPLTEGLLRSNRDADVTLTVVSVGDYDSVHFLLFPVIPPPWAARAHREDSPQLSPASGIVSGSLDWWAHSGTR